MNKYTLTFKDKNVEIEYQQRGILHQYYALKLITTSTIITLGIRGIQSIFENDCFYVIHFVLISCCLLLQLFVISQKKQYARIALTLFNNLMSVYFFSYTKVVDTNMAMMLGINQMAITFLLLFSVEFVEGVITIFNLTIFRVIWTITHSKELQFASLISSFILFYFICYFSYQFHKGKRSQFILQNVDSSWEQIIQKLLVQQPYLLVEFEEESLNFKISNNHCEQILPNCEKTQKDFLQQSVVQGKSLKNYLFQRIIECRNLAYKPSEVILNYQKRSYLIEISIYQVGTLNALLIFKDLDKFKLCNNQFQTMKYNQLCKIILKMVKRIIKTKERNIQYFDLKRKITILKLYENIKVNSNYQNIILFQLLDKVTYFCSNIRINLLLSVPIDETIHTHYKLFMMTMLIILDNSLQSHACIHCVFDKYKNIKISLKGNFNSEVIEKLLLPHKRKIEILFKDTTFNVQLITLTHKAEIFVPFQIND